MNNEDILIDDEYMNDDEYMEEGEHEAPLNKVKIIIIEAIVVLSLIIGACLYYMSENKVTPVTERVVIEYGELAPTRIRDYFTHGRFVNIEEATLDISSILINKVGIYDVTLTVNNKVTTIKVSVSDTIKPTISLTETQKNEGTKGFVGIDIEASAIIEQIEDAAGIASVEFQENQVPQYEITLNEQNVPNTKIVYDTIGIYENEIIVTDNNGLISTQKVTIQITDDYISHVHGLQDFTIEVGEEFDFMQDVTFDEKVQSVTVDTSLLDINTEGEYIITFTIKGNDGITQMKKEQMVTVIDRGVNTGNNADVLPDNRQITPRPQSPRLPNTPQSSTNGNANVPNNRPTTPSNPNTGNSGSGSSPAQPAPSPTQPAPVQPSPTPTPTPPAPPSEESTPAEETPPTPPPAPTPEPEPSGGEE